LIAVFQERGTTLADPRAKTLCDMQVFSWLSDTTNMAVNFKQDDYILREVAFWAKMADDAQSLASTLQFCPDALGLCAEMWQTYKSAAGPLRVKSAEQRRSVPYGDEFLTFIDEAALVDVEGTLSEHVLQKNLLRGLRNTDPDKERDFEEYLQLLTQKEMLLPPRLQTYNEFMRKVSSLKEIANDVTRGHATPLSEVGKLKQAFSAMEIQCPLIFEAITKKYSTQKTAVDSAWQVGLDRHCERVTTAAEAVEAWNAKWQDFDNAVSAWNFDRFMDQLKAKKDDVAQEGVLKLSNTILNGQTLSSITESCLKVVKFEPAASKLQSLVAPVSEAMLKSTALRAASAFIVSVILDQGLDKEAKKKNFEDLLVWLKTDFLVSFSELPLTLRSKMSQVTGSSGANDVVVIHASPGDIPSTGRTALDTASSGAGSSVAANAMTAPTAKKRKYARAS
jgi:hypothetical protein